MGFLLSGGYLVAVRLAHHTTWEPLLFLSFLFLLISFSFLSSLFLPFYTHEAYSARPLSPSRIALPSFRGERDVFGIGEFPSIACSTRKPLRSTEPGNPVCVYHTTENTRTDTTSPQRTQPACVGQGTTCDRLVTKGAEPATLNPPALHPLPRRVRSIDCIEIRSSIFHPSFPIISLERIANALPRRRK